MVFHIHVPKPLHGWKQFFNEVIVISVGIGIALGGEQLLERWNEHHTANKSLDAIKDELEVNLGRMKSRIATADCIDKRLSEVAAYIEGPETVKRPKWVGRPQVWSMQTSAVEAARSYGSMTILPREEQMTISTLYGTMAAFADIEREEQWSWAELRSITEDRDLTDSDRDSLRQSIQRARYAAWMLKTTSLQALSAAKELEIQPGKVGEGSKSVCIPMDTPFDEAAKQSSKMGFGEPH